MKWWQLLCVLNVVYRVLYRARYYNSSCYSICSTFYFLFIHFSIYAHSLPFACEPYTRIHKIKSGTGRNNRNGDGEYIFIIFNITQNANVWLRNVKMCHCEIAAVWMRWNECENKKVDRSRMMWRYMCYEWIRFHYLMNVNGRVWLCVFVSVCIWVVWWCTRLQRTARWNQSNRKIDGRRKKSYEIIIIIMMERRWRALLCARRKRRKQFFTCSLMAQLFRIKRKPNEQETKKKEK